MSTTIYSANYRPSSISLLHDSNGYYHLIYMVVNKINNKIYIGKHTTKNPHDSYMGSGKTLKAAIKKPRCKPGLKCYLPSGAEIGALAGICTLSTTEVIPRLETFTVKKIEVIIITKATAAVSFVINVVAVGPANTLSLLELPNIPAAEPLPLCISISIISNMQAIHCKTKANVYIMFYSPELFFE